MRLLLCFILLVHSRFARAEPFLKPNDIVALVGGEDMVVMSELGDFETLIQRALPEHRLKFRSLAWEGDTVFAQRRDLNYPTLEAQLDKIGATVVFAQFGQMESLEGKERLPDFVAAYDRLIERMIGGKDRRVVLMAPSQWRSSNYGIKLAEREQTLEAYRSAIEAIAGRNPSRCSYADGNGGIILFGNSGARDGAHLDESTHGLVANELARKLTGAPGFLESEHENALRKLVVAKNRLWHYYARPQNWAFLAGDRTNQPSSRDHKDMSKRWFPDELEQFVPLIDAKEKELWEAAAKFKR